MTASKLQIDHLLSFINRSIDRQASKRANLAYFLQQNSTKLALPCYLLWKWERERKRKKIQEERSLSLIELETRSLRELRCHLQQKVIFCLDLSVHTRDLCIISSVIGCHSKNPLEADIASWYLSKLYHPFAFFLFRANPNYHTKLCACLLLCANW